MKGEVEGHRRQLGVVRAEQAPWEAQLAELASRAAVASAERDLLLKKQADAEKRFTVRLPGVLGFLSPALCSGPRPLLKAPEDPSQDC